ncbi:MAG TPA: NAD(P)-dependent oxidoreductase, partial [Cytophagales bacterium]|nr:NAD(P)-dependent oxidoreductase [Cytophagales bacterium]
ISIHSPLNDKTRNLINAERIALLKPNAVLVNVGRGGIVHEEALANALNADQILGACIDVFDREPVKADNPLLKVDKTHKLVMTPHIAWASREAREKLLSIIVGHISKFKSDRT